MYKKITLDELCNMKSNFFSNLKNLYKKQRYEILKEFIKDIFKEWNCVYFFESNVPFFKIIKKNDHILFFDEKEKIELEIELSWLNQLHTILKDDKKISKINANNDSIVDELIKDFLNWKLWTINWKPYIVYDIETVWNINDLKNMKFVMWYSVNSWENHKDTTKYKYIWEDNLTKYVEFLLNFDWYIIWYNNIYFDNPVVCYNLNLWNDKIEQLNIKSLDLFVFLWNLTWKRYSLDKVSKSLISMWKTLDSWLVATELLNEYYKTKDPTLLSKVKNYCKNDVKMTFGLLLYLLKNQKIYIDGDYKNFDIKDMIKLWNTAKDSWNNKPTNFMLEF